MVVDFRKSRPATTPLLITNEQVEVVSKYKYLGNIIDDQLNGNENVNVIVKKANTRMYFLRKLKSLKVNKTVLTLFYNCMVQSTLTFCMSSWFNLCNSSDKKKIARVIKSAKKLGCNTTHLDCLYSVLLKSKLEKIMKNNNHPLNHRFRLLPSEKRLRSIPSNTNRLRNSFVLSAIRKFH